MEQFLYYLSIRVQGKVLQGERLKNMGTGSTLDRILELMNKHGETQVDLANLLGITKDAVSKWKTGRNKAYENKKYINKIAEHYNVSADYLLGIPQSDDSELNDYLMELKSRPEMRTLFKVSKNATKEDVEQAVKIIEALKKPNDNDFDE